MSACVTSGAVIDRASTHVELDVLIAGLEHEVQHLCELGDRLNRLFDGPDMSDLV